MKENTYILLRKAKEGDIEARNIIIENNMGLVYSVVNKFKNRGVEFDDLVQLGSIGLLNAIVKFDFSYNVMFSTYAVPHIVGEIKRFLRDNGPIKASRSYRSLSLKISFVRDNFLKKTGTEPTVFEIAKELNVDETEVTIALEATQIPESIYATYDKDGKNFLLDKLCVGAGEENLILDKISLECDTFISEKLMRYLIAELIFRQVE